MAAGIRQRHRASCKRPESGCKCPWRAEADSKRDGKKVRKTFPSRAAAASWRTDTLSAANRGELRAPSSTTVREALTAPLAGARDGTIPAAGGGRFKPATIRGYEVAVNKRSAPLTPKRSKRRS